MGFVTEEFAKRLKILREGAGMTQAQLGEKLKVSRGAISYYENAERTPDIEMLDRTSEYFQVPIEFLLGYTLNLKSEYRDMQDVYGLTDDACYFLEFHTKIGELLSKIITHEDFDTVMELYEAYMKHGKSLFPLEKDYIAFSLTTTLESIISTALITQLNLSYSQEEIDEIQKRRKVIKAEMQKREEEEAKREKEKRDRDEAEWAEYQESMREENEAREAAYNAVLLWAEKLAQKRISKD